MYNITAKDLIICMINCINNLFNGITTNDLRYFFFYYIDKFLFSNTYDFHERMSSSMASKTPCNRRICNAEYLNSGIVNDGN